MFSLITAALALTAAVKAPSSSARAHAMMNASLESKGFGKLPASCSMAGATPMMVDGSYSGGDTLAGAPVRTGDGSKGFGKLPASCSMAGATPMMVDGSYSGGDALSETPVRTGHNSDFVYGSRVPLSQALGCSTPAGGKASTQGLLKPMNFN